MASTRRLARTLFPAWPRRMQAKWVLAKIKLKNCDLRVGISSAWAHNQSHFTFARTSK
jgi:hypothetical protein